MSDTPANIHCLYVERAVPSLTLQPGDVVVIEEAIGPGESYICCHRPLSNDSLPVVVKSLLLALDKGRVTVSGDEPQAAYALLSRLAKPAARQVGKTTDLNAMLARLANPAFPLPKEPNGLDLGWDANMRDYGCIYGPPDASDIWRRFYGPGDPGQPNDSGEDDEGEEWKRGKP